MNMCDQVRKRLVSLGIGIDSRRRIARIMVSPILLALVLLSTFGGCGRPSPEDRYVRPDEITDFHVLFARNCSGCHGMDGHLGPAPPLNDPIFQAIISDEQLTELVAGGRHGTHMPAFERARGGQLTTEQVKALVTGIRKEWAGSKPEIKDLPAYTVSDDDPAGIHKADVAAGKKVFAATCAECHGDQGEGDSAGAINGSALGRLASDQFLRRMVITGRADLGMPNFSESGEDGSLSRPLNDQEIIDVVAYLRKLQTLPPTSITPDHNSRAVESNPKKSASKPTSKSTTSGGETEN